MEIKLNKRVILDEEDPDDEKIVSTNEEKILYYNSLKERLKANFRKEIFHKVDSIRILKEIKDNKYYKLDGYKSFDSFIKSYRLARSQVYVYLKIASAIEKGLIEENYIIENGIHDAFNLIQNTRNKTINKSKKESIQSLSFQLESQESYDFYKQNTKLIGFILDELVVNKKDWLQEFIDKFNVLNE
ncbi:hypothetical protein BCD_1523 (plasmid) [Borrelia crocidurae DOU]|uniref:Plasmid partition protein n=1 Tax=Borrelia crocidurae DOU TaxID=1293575 RepID=W5SKB3_9SPIR|nr:chromosome replication/partitioning protein [Borrelia crocidurae]AHH07589.1 hypothetical protein BCD_1523 [Borrelia crocidurae DOU]